MPLQFDPEYYKAFEPLIPAIANRPELRIEDIQPSRKGREAGIAAFYARLPDSPDVEQALYYCEASDGYQIPVLGFTKKDARPKTGKGPGTALGLGPGPAILHFHGGGMILGSPALYAKPLGRLVSDTSIPVFSVDYRLAPEYNGTTLVEDCYAALVWLRQNAASHNIDPARIAVFGESAGGGLAVGVALMARDRGLQPPLAKQILVYPMLDDRNVVADEATECFAFWKHKDNATAWAAVLGDKAGRLDAAGADADVSPYVAPARAESVAGLPPAYIDVGGLDIFRDENLTYAMRLLAQNITTEFHLYPGVPHAFELIAPDFALTKAAYGNRVRAMLSF